MNDILTSLVDGYLSSFIEEILLGSGSVVLLVLFKYIKAISREKIKDAALEKVIEQVLDYSREELLPNRDIVNKVVSSLNSKEMKLIQKNMDNKIKDNHDRISKAK